MRCFVLMRLQLLHKLALLGDGALALLCCGGLLRLQALLELPPLDCSGTALDVAYALPHALLLQI